MSRRKETELEGPRPPKPEEASDLEELSARCFGFHRPSRVRRRPKRSLRALAREVRIIARDGKPVSQMRVVYNRLSLYGCRVKAGSIGGVCTDPDYRGQGLASELLDHCLREMKAAGARLAFISGMRDLYSRAHAVPAGRMWQVDVTGELPLAPAGACAARPAQAEDWPSLAALHQAEPVRFVRTAEFFASALSWRGAHRPVWVIEEGGEAAAYLVLERVWDVGRGARVRGLGEYAGARHALLAGLPAVLEAAGLERIELSAPDYDRGLVSLLRSRGAEMRPGHIPYHTVRLLDLPGLMTDLGPYAAARMRRADTRLMSFAQDEDSCVLSFGGEEVRLDLRRAGAVVLGGPSAPQVGGSLGRVIAHLFPIPLPAPGLNYV